MGKHTMIILRKLSTPISICLCYFVCALVRRFRPVELLSIFVRKKNTSGPHHITVLIVYFYFLLMFRLRLLFLVFIFSYYLSFKISSSVFLYLPLFLILRGQLWLWKQAREKITCWGRKTYTEYCCKRVCLIWILAKPVLNFQI